MSQHAAQKPAKVFRAGRGLRVAIWRNEVTANGQISVRHSVKLEKRYRDDDGNFRDSSYLFEDDLPRASKLLEAAFEWIILKEENGNDDNAEFPPPAE